MAAPSPSWNLVRVYGTYAYYGIAEDGSLMPLEVYGVTE